MVASSNQYGRPSCIVHVIYVVYRFLLQHPPPAKLLPHPRVLEVVHDERAARLAQHLRRLRREHADGAHARADGRAHAGGAVLEGEARAGSDAQRADGREVPAEYRRRR